MKKILSALLVLCMVLSLTVSTVCAEGYTGFREDRPGATASAKTTAEAIKEESASKPTSTSGLRITNYDKPYAIKVDTTNQVVTIFSKGTSGDYDVIFKQFICSTGTKSNPTPAGTFKLSDAERKVWRYFKTYKTYVKYAVHIKGDYFFHSCLYSKPSEDTKYRSSSSVKKLGTKASHGCIRLYDSDCQWMFENCEAGTIVYVCDCEKDSALNKTLKENVGK